MSGPRITDAAVEAGARALASDADDEAVWPEYDREAGLVLTAALPHIRRAVIEELVEKAATEAERERDELERDYGSCPYPTLGEHMTDWLRAELEGGDRG